MGLFLAALPPRLAAAIDWCTLTECSGLLVDARLGTREADLLFVARRRDGRGRVFLLPEHCSRLRRMQVVRLRGYCQRLWEKLLAVEDAPDHVPVIVPVVVHHDASARDVPVMLGDVREAALPDMPVDDFAMLVLDLRDRSEDAVVELGMPPIATLAWLYLRSVRGGSVQELAAALERWQPLLRAVAAGPGGPDDLAIFHAYVLQNAAMPAAQLAASIDRILGQGAGTLVKTTADQLIEEGMARGLERGKAEGKAELLLSLLARRFGAVPPVVAARVHAAREAQLDAWGERLFDAASLDDLFAHE